MRMIADIPRSDQNAVRLMVYSTKKHGTFVFGFKRKEDGPCARDHHYSESDLEDAFELGEDYGIKRSDWNEIEDPHEGCQHDRIERVSSQHFNSGSKKLK